MQERRDAAVETGSRRVNPHVVWQVVVIEYVDHLRTLSVWSCHWRFANAVVVVRGRDQHESSRFGVTYVGDDSAVTVRERVETPMEDDDLLKIVIHRSRVCMLIHNHSRVVDVADRSSVELLAVLKPFQIPRHKVTKPTFSPNTTHRCWIASRVVRVSCWTDGTSGVMALMVIVSPCRCSVVVCK